MAIDYLSIGMRIKSERTKQNLTQESLADLTGISRQTISYIEIGQKGFSLESLISVCNALRISTDKILVDNLTYLTSVEESDIYYLLLDCTNEETKIITNTLTALKKSLKGYTIK